ncbi:hypothetical protein BB561_002973 [Smittium simulii]|uniref:Uncharacterized protein n=1 Tax=Smittium simulii TaxID=133385 RepID=A0A2T9YND7_9FUNG|nr:hypothetical protein BB561_002973 [Smittium simulii]
MGQETLNHIKELAEKVNQLLRERDLTVYPELIEALPSIEEDFFRSPLTDEERKSALYSCPKTSSMNYNPPPLNDSASSAVKKTDSALYGIQLELAHATRSIDFYAHRRIQDNPTLDTAEDPKTMFASTMRALLSDIAATVTQTRLDNIHREMGLPSKPQQLIPLNTKPLMDQEMLDALVASKKPAPRRQRVQPFCKRQQNSVPRDAVSSSTATAHSTNAATTPDTTSSHQDRQRAPNYVQIGVGKAHRQPMGQNIVEKGYKIPFMNPASITSPEEVKKKTDKGGQQGSDAGSGIPPVEKSYRGSTTAKAGILQPTLHNSQEDWRPPTRLRLAATKYSCGRAEFQDEDTIHHLPDDPPKRLPYVLGSSGCIYTHSDLQELQKISSVSMEWPNLSVSGPSFWPISQPPDLYRGTPPSSRMRQVKENTSLSIPGRSTYTGRNQGAVFNQYTLNLLQTCGAWIQNQRRKIIDLPISINNASWDGNQHQGNVTKSAFIQDSGPASRSQQITEGWPDDIDMSSEFHREGSVHVSSAASRATYAAPSTRTQEAVPVKVKIMGINSVSDRSSNPEPTLLEESADIMERAIIPA